MATETADAPDRLVGEVTKNAGEVIRVRRTEFRGHKLVDVRVFANAPTWGSDLVATKKGLTISPATLEALLPLLEAALDE